MNDVREAPEGCFPGEAGLWDRVENARIATNGGDTPMRPGVVQQLILNAVHARRDRDKLHAKVEKLEAAAALENDPHSVAQMFHEEYERLAPVYGYETRGESAVPWSEVPENNRNLMIATCAHVLGRMKGLMPPMMTAEEINQHLDPSMGQL